MTQRKGIAFMVDKGVVLALNGELKSDKEEYRKFIDRNNNLLIGADGGALFLEKIGFLPDVVIGDFDSLTEEKIAHLKKMGVEIKKYPVEKDETDGELALEYCRDNGYTDIIIIGSLGGRFDQQLANVFLLEYAHRSGLNAVIKEPGLELGVIYKKKVICNKKGSGISLIPLNDRVAGVSIDGCKYGLDNESLLRYKSRGISNLIVSERASISVKTGLLLYIINEQGY